MIEELLAVIARKNEERVLDNSFFGEDLVDRSELPIVVADLGIVERDKALAIARV